jgi:hypothetical protein
MILRGQLRGKIGRRRLTRPHGRIACGSGSVVEHFLAKEDVAGSNPVSRFTDHCIADTVVFLCSCNTLIKIKIST